MSPYPCSDKSLVRTLSCWFFRCNPFFFFLSADCDDYCRPGLEVRGTDKETERQALPWWPSGKASVSRVGDLSTELCFPRWKYASGSECGTLGARCLPLQGPCYRTGWLSVSILWLGEIASLICNFCRVWQHIQLPKWICPWDTLCMLCVH